MRMLKEQLFIFLMIYVSESSCVMDALYDAGERISEFYSKVAKSDLSCSDYPNTVEELLGDNYRANEIIRGQMQEVHVKLCEIEKSINSETMNNLIKIFENGAIILRCLDRMKILSNTIDDDYKIFHQIMIESGDIYNRPVHKLTASVFQNIQTNIGMIRKIITDVNELVPGEMSLITAINGYVKTRCSTICNSSQSIDEALVYLFKITIVAEVKASLMLAFANLHQYRKGTEWKIMNHLAKTQFQWYFGEYVRIMQQNLRITTGLYIRACDSGYGAWIRDENYYEFDGFSQPMIFRYTPTRCSVQSCYNKWQKRATKCDARYFDKRSGCSSTPTDCVDLGAMQACILKNGSRKFQYVNSTIFGFYGINSECPEDNGYILNNVNGMHAGYGTCGCHCDENNNKISFVIMEGEGGSNEVITGLRFKRQDNTLYIQPRVGKLLENGYIRKNSEKWLQIPNDSDASHIHPVNKENSVFFLDDVILPSKYVLTGVRFNKVTRGTVTGFAVEIFGVPFDYRSGRLELGGRISLSSSRNDSGQPLIFVPISSLQTKLDNTSSLLGPTYVQLKQSSFRSDFGQSMLPLFDAVPVTTDPPSALGGLGIFHKGVENYAGFISLRAYGIRYTEYLENFTSVHTIEGRVQLFTELQLD